MHAVGLALGLVSLVFASACGGGENGNVDADASSDATAGADIVVMPTDAAPPSCDDMPDAGYVFCDNFDQSPLPHFWTTFVGGNGMIGLTTDRAVSLPNALRASADPGMIAGARTTVPVTSTRFIVSFQSYAPAIAANPMGNVDILQVTFGPGRQAGVGLSPQAGMPPRYYLSLNGVPSGFGTNDADAWIHITLTVDMAARTLALSVGGGQTRIPAFGSGTETTASLAVGVLSNSMASMNTQWIDDVRVQE